MTFDSFLAAPDAEAERAPRPRSPPPRTFARPLAWLVAICCSIGTWAVADFHLRQAAYSELSRLGQGQVEQYYTGIETELARLEHAPALFDRDPDVIGLLTSAQPGAANRIHQKLLTIAEQVKASGLYIADSKGKVVAASDETGGSSLVGHRWPEDGAFADALRGSGLFVSRVPTHGNASFTFSRAIEHGGVALGVALVQADLSGFEKSWWPGLQRAMLVDQRGVVTLSATLDWKYKVFPLLSTGPGEPANDALPKLDMQVVASLDDGSTVLRILTPTPIGMTQVQFVARHLTIPAYGWSLVVLTEATEQLRSARNGAIALGLAAALASVLLIAGHARHRVLRSERRSQEDLVKRTRNELMRTQDELVQAGKLATLGQMAAGITHELSQPLHALNMYCNNASQLNERGQAEGVARNLRAIQELSDRMERITGQLRGFARKDGMRLEPVDLELAVRKSLDILSPRIAKRRGKVILNMRGAHRVIADAHRLEQVFINLVANALDAAAGGSFPLVEVHAEPAGEWVRVLIRDNGPGISKTAMSRMFEPFFTMKRGEGLGLGLVITASILRAFGSSLVARNRDPQAGAEFEFTLKGAPDA